MTGNLRGMRMLASNIRFRRHTMILLLTTVESGCFLVSALGLFLLAFEDEMNLRLT
jgi:hypothetical protein